MVLDQLVLSPCSKAQVPGSAPRHVNVSFVEETKRERKGCDESDRDDEKALEGHRTHAGYDFISFGTLLALFFEFDKRPRVARYR